MHALESRDGRHRYPIANDVVDMRVPPERLQVNLPWAEIRDELDALRLSSRRRWKCTIYHVTWTRVSHPSRGSMATDAGSSR